MGAGKTGRAGVGHGEGGEGGWRARGAAVAGSGSGWRLGKGLTGGPHLSVPEGERGRRPGLREEKGKRAGPGFSCFDSGIVSRNDGEDQKQSGFAWAGFGLQNSTNL
uniref:Uncharacterized protein n=1 Tax=Oryza sativa subsp. japonica TaxID=39947 RepID=Q84MT1_ORYSJ|nr:hypothetical protein [Oryza sativa Japonica Group]